MALPAQSQNARLNNRRVSPRCKVLLGASGRSADDIVIHELSLTGLLIETGEPLAPFDSVEIELPEVGMTQAVVVWKSGRYFGCEFAEPVTQAAISAALLRTPPEAPADVAPPAAVPELLLEGPKPAKTQPDGPAGVKAPPVTRLRVMFASALALWALIIWALVTVIG